MNAETRTETTGRPTSSDPDVRHVVCHCTNDETAFCHHDATEDPWVSAEVPACPLCALVCEQMPNSCPWGCDCAGECGP